MVVLFLLSESPLVSWTPSFLILRQGCHHGQRRIQRRVQARRGASDHGAGLPGGGVLQRLGVSQHSLYEWCKKLSKPAAGSGEDDQAAEVRRLKRELALVTEERGSKRRVGVTS